MTGELTGEMRRGLKVLRDRRVRENLEHAAKIGAALRSFKVCVGCGCDYGNLTLGCPQCINRHDHRRAYGRVAA